MYRPARVQLKLLMAALAILASLSMPAWGQDRYRAEVVILERLDNPLLEEDMAGREPEPTVSDKRLLVVDADGNRLSDINTTTNLTLNQAADRLEKSGKYRVLMRTGWIQNFPSTYRGEPMRIDIGDYLEGAGHREVEGTIQVDRRRFLLGHVKLNHWRSARSSGSSEDDQSGSRDSVSAQTVFSGRDSDNKELVNWIRETRRMRSNEIHYIDSPTIGVLLYFRKL